MNTRTVRQAYRLYPTAQQEQLLAQLFGATRVVYNTYLYTKDQAYKNKTGEPALDLAHKGRATAAGLEWLNDYAVAILQQALIDAQTAYQNYFDSKSGKRKGEQIGHPKYRNKKRGRQSLRWCGEGSIKTKKLNRKWSAVRLPQTAGKKPEVWIKYRSNQDLHSTPTTVTIIRNSDSTYTVSFVTEQPVALPRIVGPTAGVDLGLTDLATYVDSSGARYKVKPLKAYRSRERKLARVQRSLARKKKDSNNRARARLRVAQAHSKITRTRLDSNRKLALQLIGENQALGLETLAVKNLVKNRRLAKSISDASWTQLASLIESTGQREGCRVVRADRYYPSSQAYSCCGVSSGKKELSVREWACACGLLLDRDFNAAVNLLLVAAGLAETLNDCGGPIRRELACAGTSETVTSFLNLL